MLAHQLLQPSAGVRATPLSSAQPEWASNTRAAQRARAGTCTGLARMIMIMRRLIN